MLHEDMAHAAHYGHLSSEFWVRFHVLRPQVLYALLRYLVSLQLEKG